MANGNYGVLGRLKVGQKLTLMSAAFIAAIAGIVYFAVNSIDNQKDDTLQIDLAGRQRVLAHRFVLQVRDVRNGAKIDYQDTIQTFDRTLAVLETGGLLTRNLIGGGVETEEVPAVDVPAVKPMFATLAKLSNDLKRHAAEYIAVPAANAALEVEVRTKLNKTLEETHVEATKMVRALRADSRQQIRDIIYWIIAVGVVAAILAVSVAMMISRSISRPLIIGAEFAQRIANGELNVQPLEIRGDDEIGQLSVAFNSMVESIRNMNKEIRAATNALNSASTEILATVQQQASSANEQAAAVQEITSTVEEINQSSGQVSERAREVATAGQSIASAGNDGLDAVQETSRAMESIREQAETVARNVVALSQSTQAIGEIIATVTDIAEQSNLVALNAGIEAADAREEGRRFSVVANEMKNLADQAKAATGQVRNILEEIQKGINTSVMLTEEAVKRVEVGRERTDIAQQSIRDMSDSISSNVIVFEQIVGATSQQKIGIEQVTKALHGIREGSQQTVAGTQQLTESARNLNTLSQQLRQTVERFQS